MKSDIIYLTFNEAPSGIFSGQVIDTVKFISLETGTDVRLVSFVSMRNFFEYRKKIRREIANCTIIPMFPTIRLWKLNRFTLFIYFLFRKRKTIIARSIWATWLAFYIRRKKKCERVVYDGRGAIYHECLEYNVLGTADLNEEVMEVEKRSILESDSALAVSQKLVDYWKNKYGYAGKKHSIIPCTLNEAIMKNEIIAAGDKKLEELGWNEENIILIYSGSTAGWQSFSTVIDVLRDQLEKNNLIRVLFLSSETAALNELKKSFPGRVVIKKTTHEEVFSWLKIGDYGLLIRENSVSNSVASPVKFAEYLYCGLKILISSGVGDYTDFTVKENCGLVVNEDFFKLVLEKNSPHERSRLKLLAETNFKKKHFKTSYLCLVNGNNQ